MVWDSRLPVGIYKEGATMNPTENIKRQLELVQLVKTHMATYKDIEELADLITAMDSWMSNNGYLPLTWISRSK